MRYPLYIWKELHYHIYMMGYDGGWGMMGDAGLVGTITWLVIIVDLVLAGIWLWQRISKK